MSKHILAFVVFNFFNLGLITLFAMAPKQATTQQSLDVTAAEGIVNGFFNFVGSIFGEDSDDEKKEPVLLPSTDSSAINLAQFNQKGILAQCMFPESKSFIPCLITGLFSGISYRIQIAGKEDAYKISLHSIVLPPNTSTDLENINRGIRLYVSNLLKKTQYIEFIDMCHDSISIDEYEDFESIEPNRYWATLLIVGITQKINLSDHLVSMGLAKRIFDNKKKIEWTDDEIKRIQGTLVTYVGKNWMSLVAKK